MCAWYQDPKNNKSSVGGRNLMRLRNDVSKYGITKIGRGWKQHWTNTETKNGKIVEWKRKQTTHTQNDNEKITNFEQTSHTKVYILRILVAVIFLFFTKIQKSHICLSVFELACLRFLLFFFCELEFSVFFWQRNLS